MTRKDYTALAYHLSLVEPADNVPVAHAAWTASCRAIADCLQDDNTRFDRTRFLEACKYLYWKGRTIPR